MIPARFGIALPPAPMATVSSCDPKEGMMGGGMGMVSGEECATAGCWYWDGRAGGWLYCTCLRCISWLEGHGVFWNQGGWDSD